MGSPRDMMRIEERTLRRAQAAFELDRNFAGRHVGLVYERLSRLRVALKAGDSAEVDVVCLEIEAADRPVTRGGRITSPQEGEDATVRVDSIVLLQNKLIGDLDRALEDLGAGGRA
jgi:hypothetical protein